MTRTIYIEPEDLGKSRFKIESGRVFVEVVGWQETHEHTKYIADWLLKEGYSVQQILDALWATNKRLPEYHNSTLKEYLEDIALMEKVGR